MVGMLGRIWDRDLRLGVSEWDRKGVLRMCFVVFGDLFSPPRVRADRLNKFLPQNNLRIDTESFECGYQRLEATNLAE